MIAPSVTAAEHALIDALTAWPALAGVHVGDLPAATPPPQTDRVYFVGFDDYARTSEYELGLRHESYLLLLVVEVAWSPTTRRAVRDRTVELWSAVENAVAQDGSLEASVWTARLERVEDGGAGTTDRDGWVARMRLWLRVDCEIADA